MRIFYSLITVLALFMACTFMPGTANARSETIAIVVNDGIISKSDVDERMKLIITSSGLPNNQKIKTQLLPQIIGSLIDERIRLQEAEKLGLTITPAEISQGITDIAAQNNVTREQFEGMITQSGINITTMKEQIKAQLAWSKIVQAKVRSKIIVSDSDIDAKLELLTSNKGKNEYLVSEIFLPLENVGEEQKLRGLAQKLVKEIRSGKAPFFKIAQQFSKAAGAAQGGNLGWIQQGQLSTELDNVLKQMTNGMISDPVRSLSGFHILLLREKRMISDETIPSRENIMRAIGTERLERAQRRYFLDLKSTAFIDNRL